MQEITLLYVAFVLKHWIEPKPGHSADSYHIVACLVARRLTGSHDALAIHPPGWG